MFRKFSASGEFQDWVELRENVIGFGVFFVAGAAVCIQAAAIGRETEVSPATLKFETVFDRYLQDIIRGLQKDDGAFGEFAGCHIGSIGGRLNVRLCDSMFSRVSGRFE